MEPMKTPISFRQMEEETLEEARLWAQRRLQEKLEKLLEEQGAISPPERPAAEAGAVASAQAAKHRRRDRG